MNKIKIALTAIAGIATVGGVFAFKKASVLNGRPYYIKSTLGEQACTLTTVGFLYTTKVTTAASYITYNTVGLEAPNCLYGAYFIHNAQ